VKIDNAKKLTDGQEDSTAGKDIIQHNEPNNKKLPSLSEI